MAAPNVLPYYHAANLCKIFQLWKETSRSSWDSEYIIQEERKVLLSVLILNFGEYKTSKAKCLGHKALIKTWEIFSELAAPSPSAIANFLWPPKFQVAASCSDFRPWIEKGLTQFYLISRQRNMFSKEEMTLKLGFCLEFEFQYRQVYNLVKSLQQKYDLFQPMALFESLAINIQNQKSLLAQLYNWLLIKTGESITIKSKSA